MERTPLCCLLGSAFAAVVLFGCSSRSPFTDNDNLQQPYDPAPITAHRRSLSPPAPNDQSEPDLPVLDENATLEDYLRYAALKNAGLEASFQDWKAAVERSRQVGTLPDPRFTYGYYLGEVETRVGPMQHSVALAQTFPWFGKLQGREDAAARQARAAHRRFESTRLELFLKVEEAYNELYFLKRSVDITHDTIELVLQLEQVARTRYRVAAAGHPDIIRIQIELGTLEDRLLQLRDLRAPFTARLNAALSRPASAAVPWPATVAERVIDADRDALSATLRQHNPQLGALQETIERERIRTALARKDGLPDVTVGLAYTAIGTRDSVAVAENGDDALLATFSINLPIWREKYDAGVREAIARRLAAASRHRDAAHQLASGLQQAIFEHDDAIRRVGLYRDTLIPKATESLQASLGGFRQGTSDFLDLIDTERTLLEFQLALARALVDRATSYARIEQLIGVRLTDVTPASASQEDGS